MKERPILFSAPMVRAILDGTKTQTRRTVKGAPLDWLSVVGFSPDFVAHPENDACPYGKPGDRLWVREAWGYFDPRASGENYDDHHEEAGPGPVAYCDELLQEGHPLRDFWRRRVAYKATFAEDKYGKGPVGPKKWRPSIHMPRWASRITLGITDIRVERLQDISTADAWAEGIPGAPLPGVYVESVDELARWSDGVMRDNPKTAYCELWESINGAGSWDANPWVWCVGFKRLEA